jgi:hypothetical protein
VPGGPVCGNRPPWQRAWARNECRGGDCGNNEERGYEELLKLAAASGGPRLEAKVPPHCSMTAFGGVFQV